MDSSSWIYTLKIQCKIQIAQWHLEVEGLIDIGCSNTILDLKLVPPQYHTSLDPTEQFYAEQMDGRLYKYEYILAKHKLSYYLGDGSYT